MDIKISIKCDKGECNRMLKAFQADDTGEWKTTSSDDRVEVEIKADKITSLYNLTDDLLRSYEVFKKLDEEQL